MTLEELLTHKHKYRLLNGTKLFLTFVCQECGHSHRIFRGDYRRKLINRRGVRWRT